MRKTLALLSFGLACLLFLAPVAAQDAVATGATTGLFTAPDGTPAQVQIPVELHMRNRGGNDRTKDNPRGLPGLVADYRLLPGVPDFLITPSIVLGDVFEKIPLVKNVAQSIFITAGK